MHKIAVRVSGERSFFEEVVREAARLDRSPSWLLGHCLGETLPKLASALATALPAATPSDRPQKRTFFVPMNLLLDCGGLAARLGMCADDVVAMAWQASRDSIRAMPSS